MLIVSVCNITNSLILLPEQCRNTFKTWFYVVVGMQKRMFKLKSFHAVLDEGVGERKESCPEDWEEQGRKNTLGIGI